MTTPLLEAIEIDKTFMTHRGGSIRTHLALSKVSVALRPGETLGLVGESGSGKTTLSRILIGIETADNGSVRFKGRQVLTRDDWKWLRRQVQYVFQDPSAALCPTMRVGKALAEPLAIHDLCSAAERPDRVADMLAMVGLRPDLAGRLPHQLSGGQRQRVNLARSLMLQPEVLICDEIVSGLDVSVQAHVLALLVSLQKKLGLSLIFISHDLRVVHYVCDRVAVMLSGKIVDGGKTSDVFDRPSHPYTRALLAAVATRHREVAT